MQKTLYALIELQEIDSKLPTTITTTGDVIYSSSGTTAARLGIGSAGQVMQVVGGIPAWAAAPAASFDYVTKTGAYKPKKKIKISPKVLAGLKLRPKPQVAKAKPKLTASFARNRAVTLALKAGFSTRTLSLSKAYKRYGKYFSSKQIRKLYKSVPVKWT